MGSTQGSARAWREFCVSSMQGLIAGGIVFSAWAAGLHVFMGQLNRVSPELGGLVAPQIGRNMGIAGGVSFIVAVAFAWLRIQAHIQGRLNPSNLELFDKLTHDLPGLLYQFRQWPSGMGSVTYASAAIRTIYELEPAEARRNGNQILSLVHPDDYDRIFQSLLHSHASLSPWDEEFRVVLPRAGISWRHAHARVERLPDGGTLWHGFVIDISEDKRSRDELEAAVRRAEVASQTKNRLIAMLSHDLRNPLSGILGYSYLLRDTPLDDLQRDHVTAIENCGGSLLALVNDLLDVSRIEAGHLSISPSPFDLPEFLTKILAVFRPRAAAAGLALNLDLAENLPAGIVTDRVRLSQVLTNLLANAVKFTAVGSVTLRVGCSESPHADPRWFFSVVDTGPGIPAAQLEAIFEEFRQLSDAAHPEGGAGLGLAITRQICRRLGGDVRAESQVGRGSTFTATILAPIATLPPVSAGELRA